MIHYELSRQERTQITGRWHEGPAPLCSTGDGHYVGVHPDKSIGSRELVVTCPVCCENRHMVAPRERNRIDWQPVDRDTPDLAVGTKVSTTVYGQPRTGVIEHTGRTGSVVFVRMDDGKLRWLGRDSVTPIDAGDA
jgi:hypothetical protein